MVESRLQVESLVERPLPLITAEQIGHRVMEMGRQISHDCRGRTVHVLPVLENSFVFAADLIRAMDVPVACEFIKPLYRDRQTGRSSTREIFFSPEIEVRGHHVLLVEGVLHSGVTTEFLISGMLVRGAASVKLVTLLERQCARRVALQPDYFGFLVEDAFLVGYGMGSPVLWRNLPYVGMAEPERG